MIGRSAIIAAIVATVALAATARDALRAQQPPRITLDTVSVVASRARAGDAGRDVEIITREAIARSAARSVTDVLADAMSVDVYGRSAAQADVSIRGSSAEQVVVLVDGVRMTDVQSTHYTLDLAVPLASVERIEILRGAGSALYGPDAVGGVINIVTRPAATSVRAHGGSFGTAGGSLAVGRTRGTVSLGVSADLERSDGHRDGTDYRNGQGRVSLSVPALGGVLRSNAALGIRDFGAADFYAPYESVERTTTTTLDSRWTHLLGTWQLEVAGSSRRHQDHYVLVRDNPSLYENRHETWQTGGELVARRTAGPVALALGADGAHHQLSSARLGGHREWRAAVFADASVGDPSRATAHAGLRGDHSSVYGDYVSPSVSLSAIVRPHVEVRASGGGGFRAPTWTERFYVDPANQGDPELRPERFWSGDGGVRATAGAWALSSTVFVRRATRLIDWVKPASQPSSVWRTHNVGEATYTGLETSLDLPDTRWLETSMFGTWVHLDASEGDTLLGKYALRPLTQQAGARIASPAGRALGARLELVRARRASEKPYFTGSARVAWERKPVRLTLDVRNLTDADWLDASGKRVAGRGVYVGLEWGGP